MPNYNTAQLLIIRIPGDGSCLFRAVVHGSFLIRGKPTPSESLQKKLAHELRDKVVDELIKRREDTEWCLEDEFDRYICQMRQCHVWGGEPELLMASHVLKMPITVYMLVKKSSSFITIAEYGQEYGRENPIRVLYHGYGHYDALESNM
ncbi:OVARIAN TUMOR DOMAIN-containing deubiquitinating enzyme 4 [Beta vulgaris subsp. vulgaris]|uniref:OVARIAN TUMOR DOMAIN-containing deubiquitinating enzyme 4 n=1 Tax=Beta vulgaris subsp. vulgaris TaxID=3555 RepID=UPI0020373ADE|nr:OVARIAN TUMOR DOMAIN-containing deubiquitinating enzyme 4 [Beta vulgaris subsp. vulgaris]XP_048503284.1 OVARIAN TUMOR DOMAIN-containing deubiquitinating enzyme 4 [Beta vulgaris subsp. vulgaris]